MSNGMMVFDDPVNTRRDKKLGRLSQRDRATAARVSFGQI